jgi:hypothetical protein
MSEMENEKEDVTEPEDTVDDYLRLRQTNELWVYEVARVEWPHPHTPHLIWEPFRTWRKEPSTAGLQAARCAAIKHAFCTCTLCHELHPRGHMHDRTICQGCAEGFLGVVH